MSRRAPLPGASEMFFRDTAQGTVKAPTRANGVQVSRRGSPRSKHDTKITVYLSQDELIALESARLALRAEHGMSVDRGRLVREAVAVMLADLHENGDNSVLVRRLREPAP